MKKKILMVLVPLLLGLAVGYYFGYDNGFEKAAKLLR